jgi:hypothetical protein
MDVETLIGVNTIPVDDRIQALTALMYEGNDSVVSVILSRGTDSQCHETCLRALRLLTDARIELASLKTGKPV